MRTMTGTITRRARAGAGSGTRLLRTGCTAVALALGAALPAFAQEGLCGGVGAAGVWIGGSEAGSDISTTDVALEQMALVMMRDEYVSLFTLSAPTEVRIEGQGRGNGDAVIDLRNAAGEMVLSDDDSGGNSDARAEAPLDPGRYCLSLRSFDGSPMTGFVRIGRTEHAALTTGFSDMGDPGAPGDGGDDSFGGDSSSGDPGEACTADTPAGDLAAGAIDAMLGGAGVSGSGSANDRPFWRFSLEAPAALTLTATNASADPVIALYDADGNLLAENDDFDGLDSRVDMVSPLAAGSYCIGIRALSDSALPIRVAVSAYDAAAAMTSRYDRGEASPPLDGSHPVTALGEIGSRLRQDVQTTEASSWFSLDVTAPGLLLVEAVTNGQGDPILYLFDDFGRPVAMNDDRDGSLDSLLTARVAPGTYLIGLRQVSSGTQGLVRLLIERYVPAP